MKLILYYLFASSFIFFALYNINIECLAFIIYEVHWNILFLFSFLFILHIHILIIFMLHDKLRKVCIMNLIWYTFITDFAYHTSEINRTLFKKVSFLLDCYYNNNDAANKYHLINYLYNNWFCIAKDLFIFRLYIYIIFLHVASFFFSTRDFRIPRFYVITSNSDPFLQKQEFFFWLIESRSTALCILESPYCLFHDW